MTREFDSSAAVVVAMVDKLDVGALQELERVMQTLRAGPAPRPGEEHSDSLAFLAELVSGSSSAGASHSRPWVARKDYEATRPINAPPSRARATFRFVGESLSGCFSYRHERPGQ